MRNDLCTDNWEIDINHNVTQGDLIESNPGTLVEGHWARLGRRTLHQPLTTIVTNLYPSLDQVEWRWELLGKDDNDTSHRCGPTARQ